mgnify:CR=1 FL=1
MLKVNVFGRVLGGVVFFGSRAVFIFIFFFFFQAEDGIRGLVRSRGLGDVYKRQRQPFSDPRRVKTLGTLLKSIVRYVIYFVGAIMAPVSYTHLTLPTIYSV